MDNGDYECEKCGGTLEHKQDDFCVLYCPMCDAEVE